MPTFKDKAVWYSAVKHINYLLELGTPVTVYLCSDDRKCVSEIRSSFLKEVKVVFTVNKFLTTIFLLFSSSKAIYVTDVIDAFYAIIVRLFTRKEIIFWVQGVIPEEDYLKFNSKFRYWTFSLLERLSMRFCSKFVFVSEGMKEHFEKKFTRKFFNSIVVPCISELKYQNLPRIENSYVYIGGLSVWQKFDEILRMFNKIGLKKPTSKLFIVTFSKERAIELVNSIINPWLLDNVRVLTLINRDEIGVLLSQMEYGFLLREESVINYVASPIKFAEYISCGVNPIISSSLKSYATLTAKYSAGIVVENFKLKNAQIFKPAEPDLALTVSSRYFSKTTQLCRYRALLSDIKLAVSC